MAQHFFRSMPVFYLRLIQSVFRTEVGYAAFRRDSCASEEYDSFAFFDQSGTRRHTLISGEPAKAVMSFYASEPIKEPVAVVAIYRPDSTCALQVVSNRENATLGILENHGRIIVSFAPLLLGPGEYIISIALFKELNIASRHEPEAYDLHDRCYVLKILPPPGLGVEIGIVNQSATWEIAS